MGGRRVERRILDATAAVVRFATHAANSAPHSKLLLFGAFAASLAVVAVPILFRVDMTVAAGTPLKCYDSTGNYEPCVLQAGASPQPFNDRTAEDQRPASWTITALYQQASLQQASLPTAEPDQPASSTTSAPAAQHTGGKRPASAICGHLLPCLFSSLRRGLTRIASAAANAGRARPAREHL
jgi:hypothetical protein